MGWIRYCAGQRTFSSAAYFAVGVPGYFWMIVSKIALASVCFALPFRARARLSREDAARSSSSGSTASVTFSVSVASLSSVGRVAVGSCEMRKDEPCLAFTSGIASAFGRAAGSFGMPPGGT